ncbi:MAG: pyridoxal-phosphate dependent enzyme, partial [Gemmatimonadaceae bacterium]|nr:pyridoxal-phosphate dependent enzyme [Gemmatimonadaceae bacterium]
LERGAVFVEDGAWPEVAEGAGTIAHELTEALPHAELPEVMLVPLGNGALLTGIGAWLRHASPATRIIGVAAAGAPSMQRSFAARRTVSTPSVATIADGIAVREPVPYAVDAMPALVDDVVLVSEGAIVAAMRLLHEQLGLVIEPAGAVGIAALLGDDGASMHPWRGARIATPLCGGNVTAEQVQRWLLP